MNTPNQSKQSNADPLGLSQLDDVEPGYDGWNQVESALTTHNINRTSRTKAGAWLAMAASLVLVISVVLLNIDKTEPGAESSPALATSFEVPTSVEVKDNVNALIGLSQSMEEQVAKLRHETPSMPAESAIYVAELEDLIAQVDNELSQTPGSIDLWGQRVNLMLDLAQIYQQQWEIDYGRIALL